MITLNGNSLIELLDLIAPDRDSDQEQLETEVCLIQMEKPFASSDGDVHKPGLYAYFVEYPGEGLYGPL